MSRVLSKSSIDMEDSVRSSSIAKIQQAEIARRKKRQEIERALRERRKADAEKIKEIRRKIQMTQAEQEQRQMAVVQDKDYRIALARSKSGLEKQLLRERRREDTESKLQVGLDL